MDEFGYPELARAALGFVLEDESWPVFVKWVETNSHSERMHEFMDANDLASARRLWIDNRRVINE